MKRLLGVLLVVMMLFGFTLNSMAATKLTDVKDTDWFAENVTVLVEKGIIGGYPDGSYKPNNFINADEFIKTMVVALGYKLENAEGYWAQTFIDKAIELGIVKSGEFIAYNRAITRGEMSRIVVRTVEVLEGVKTYKYGSSDSSIVYKAILDKKDMPTGLRDFICKSYELGIIGGYPDGTFKPNVGLKRSESATVIRRVIETGIRVPFDQVVSEEEKGFLEKYGYPVFVGEGDIKIDITTNKAYSTWSGITYLRSGEHFELGIDPFDGAVDVQYYEAKIIMTTVLKISADDADKIIQMADQAWNTRTPFSKVWFKTTDGKDFYVESENSGRSPGGIEVRNDVY